MQHGGYVGGATGITMERWSLGIAATWYMIMPPLWLYGIDGGVWFCRRSDFQEIGGYDETVPFGDDVEFLCRLKRLGASRPPRQKLATRFTAKKIGIPPAVSSIPRGSGTGMGTGTCSRTYCVRHSICSSPAVNWRIMLGDTGSTTGRDGLMLAEREFLDRCVTEPNGLPWRLSLLPGSPSSLSAVGNQHGRYRCPTTPWSN